MSRIGKVCTNKEINAYLVHLQEKMENSKELSVDSRA